MPNSLQWLSGFDAQGGGLPLLVGAAAVVMLIVLGSTAIRRSGQGALAGTLWGAALVLLGALGASVFTWMGDEAAQRRSVEARIGELTARAMAPGSALACLDAIANADVESACEKSLFATPEAVANAIAYVDAKISLLAASAPLAARNPAAQPSVERTRRALEADRFGLVAHVLHTRGCEAADCPDLKHLRNTSHILTNMKAQTFGSYVSLHASTWQAGSALATIAAPPAGDAASQVPVIQPSQTPATVGARVPDQFNFPSSTSIPAVSIMNAEPPLPAGAVPPAAATQAPAETRATPAVSARRPQAAQSRRPSSREPAPAPREAAREQAPQEPAGPLPPPPPLTSGQR